MKIRLSKYGMPQVVILPAVIVVLMILCLAAGQQMWPVTTVIICEVILLVFLLWVLAFFRDPSREIPDEPGAFLSPADGTVTDIEIIREESFIGSRSLRIGIFLSIFDVHINRIPCAVRIEKIAYKAGSYRNAMNPAAGRTNESNDIGMVRLNEPQDRILLRQISGAIARRIVCELQTGQNLPGGEKFGMLKFGSRTELYVPIREQNITCLVKVGDKVKGGLTVLARYK
ncbi:MAG: phosphatidylserine decarboxylase [Planctomycetota bacterium]